MPSLRLGQGFTLVELMITVAVAVLLVGIALPSFDAVFNAGRINSEANEFVATLQLARMEAIRRNARVVVCPSANQTACDGGNPTAWTGWLAFVDDGGFNHNAGAGVAGNAGNGSVDANETVLRVGAVRDKVQVQTSTNISGSAGGAITFRADGLARDVGGNLLKGAFSVCTPVIHPSENVRDVAISSGSRVSVSRINGGGACAVPANP